MDDRAGATRALTHIEHDKTSSMQMAQYNLVCWLDIFRELIRVSPSFMQRHKINSNRLMPGCSHQAAKPLLMDDSSIF
jgi:hypothetical protein